MAAGLLLTCGGQAGGATERLLLTPFLKLRLDGDTVYPGLVEDLADLLGERVECGHVRTLDVEGGHVPALNQLPNMHLVDARDPMDLGDVLHWREKTRCDQAGRKRNEGEEEATRNGNGEFILIFNSSVNANNINVYICCAV